MATVGKGTHRMPMETTAEYSRFRSMGKKRHRRKGKERTIKERKGKKRKGKEREKKERKGKERKGTSQEKRTKEGKRIQ